MVLDLGSADVSTLYDVQTVRDDAEEDLVGSDLHQDAITEAHAAIASYAREQGLPWYVTKQVMMIIPLPGREDWHPSPDVYVVPGISGHARSSYDARVEPIPPFVIEVISPSTARRDLGVKRRIYELIGVREYLIFDPTGESLGAAVRAWRQDSPAGSASAPQWNVWRPDRDDTWRSDVLGLGFRPVGVLLRVVQPDGQIVLTRRELEDEVRRLRLERDRP